MSSPLPTALPYGIRDCKLTRYADASGTSLGEVAVDLPNTQTFSFSETEEYTELRGDDKVITTRGQGAQVEWELEAGGMSLQAWSVFSGGEIIEQGVSPGRQVICRKYSSSSRPFFKIEGQAISDSGGDIHGIVYRCRANDTIEGEFADGEFFATSVSGVGLPLLDEGFDLLYDWVHNETAQTIGTTAVANPTGGPSGLSASNATTTSIDLNWNSVDAASGYRVERSEDGSAWTAVTSDNGGEPSTANTTVLGLTAGTQYWFRVSSVVNGAASPPSNTVVATTLTAA